MSKTMLGTVLGLYVSQDGEQKRDKREFLEFDLDGVCGDKFKGKDIYRSVLLVSMKSYELVKQNGIEMDIGDLGENLLLDFDPYELEEGEQLKIGGVTLEIAQRSSLCRSLSKISSKLPKLLKDKRGIFARVIESGTVKKGDSVHVILQNACCE